MINRAHIILYSTDAEADRVEIARQSKPYPVADEIPPIHGVSERT